ncbi:hypothetical protein D0863_10224 [Hortaea werneckii]|uniref:Mediator of RNA polymerase II transcription subunit 13 n=1 Tax=Hortaea werneckii TaxID=91943 RepID=A0A3M7DI19_HORWE|nr:hypothetical protein D0863_10224 [Hortaea werneckii]
MDFLKNCKSNVQVTDGLKTLECHVYNANNGYDVQDSVAKLRSQGALCASSKQQLWIFGQLDNNVQTTLADKTEELLQEQNDTLDSLTLKAGLAGYNVSSILFDAIQGAVSSALYKACGATRIGPFSWLLPAEPGEASVVLHLHLNLTESGTLYATTTTGSESLTHLTENRISRHSDVLLAPSGIHATSLSKTDSSSAFSSASWQDAVKGMLRVEGIVVGDDTVWLPVKLRGPTSAEDQIFTWPATMCFGQTVKAKSQACEGSWKSWFAASDDPHGFSYPLADAEEWFKGAESRLQAADATSTVRDSLAEAQRDHVDAPQGASNIVENNIGLTAPFNQRVVDQQASMAGIYPTPEDNLMPGHTNHHPSSDNNALASIPEQKDQQDTGENNVAGDTGDQARLSSSSSDPMAFAQNNDDLFGDMGGMEFGGEEVDDADFDFFNEQDEMPTVPDMPVIDEDAEMSELRPDDDELAVENADVVPPPQDPANAAKTPDKGNLDQVHPSALDSGTNFDQSIQLDERETPAPNSAFERPLSPFGVKERLLPPPVPASANLKRDREGEHQRSSFGPILFRDGLDLGRKYSDAYGPSNLKLGAHVTPQKSAPYIGLPRKRADLSSAEDAAGDVDSDSESSSDESDVSDHRLPPQLPWNPKKRRRPAVQDGDQWWLPTDAAQHLRDDGKLDKAQTDALLESITHAKTSAIESSVQGPAKDDEPPTVEDLYIGVTKLDLVYIAQLVGEQAVSCTKSILKQLEYLPSADECLCSTACMTRGIVSSLLGRLLPGMNDCDLSSLALVREPPSRTAQQAPSRPGQPRPPPPRFESANLGPDMMSLAPPYVRIHRGNDPYEMLPPALSFWEPLSLSPSSGAKDIRAYCIFPLNEDLQRLVDNFLSDLGTTYENSRLGSHAHIRNVEEDIEGDDYEDGLVPVDLGDESDNSMSSALQAYHSTCNEFGRFLAHVGHVEPERTIVVYMLNPFDQSERILQHLCACFWQLYKAYRDGAPKPRHAEPRSDIVMQVLPVDLVASADTVITLDLGQLGTLAREVYGRCPPSALSGKDVSSALPNFSAPFAELATPPPKRISFQLSAEPPSDLMHEGSSLHLAYAISPDREWMTVAWTDSTGKNESGEAFCLRGKSFADVASEAWERTRDLLAAREVTWRVFIVTVGEMAESYKQCWRHVIEKPRKQPFSVTLLLAKTNPDLQVSTPAPADDGESKNAGSGATILTPATTPQGTAVTVSPDTNGSNAPPTPAPSDPAATIAETDPEAILVDLADETWGMLFSPTSFPTGDKGPAASRSIASGALFKRGGLGLETSTSALGRTLPSLVVNLLWTVQVRPNGNVDEGNVKQSEMTLREVLRLYRNLGVLTKARGIAMGDEETSLPVHLLTAVRGAQAVSGLLAA